MTTMTTLMQLMVPTERDNEVGDHTGGEEGPGRAQTNIKTRAGDVVASDADGHADAGVAA